MTDEEFLNGVVGVVEANSFETMYLWQEYKDDWDDRSWGGYLITVGHLGKRPVCVSMLTRMVKGHKILFINATSEVVDYAMIDEWLKKNLPKSALNERGYVNKVDATNFHNVFPRQTLVDRISASDWKNWDASLEKSIVADLDGP